jgi:predicted class III extradiol MEMO1 family dioxygenase
MATRKPSHAGSWYTANGQQLSQQLDGWLEAVPSSTTPIGSASSQQGEVSIPTPNARAIIAPWATTNTCGEDVRLMDTQARWILVLRACCGMGLQERRLGECVRLSSTSQALSNFWYSKRVFLIGPSHHYYLTGAATTGCDKYSTPLGDLTIDTALVQQIQQEWGLETMSKRVDEEEHSLEMHLPYIYKMLSL